MNQTITFDESITLDYIEKHSVALSFVSSEGNKILVITLPLLSLAIKLRNLPSVFNIAKLKKLLEHQIEVVCDEVQRASYNAEIVAATQYALCAFTDECIMTTDWGQASEWDKNGLLQHFTASGGDGKKFFAMVKELYADAHKNVDVLELFYVCLSLGFAGKYRQHKKGQQVIKEIMDELYESITRYRKIKENNGLIIKPSNIQGGIAAGVETVAPKKLFVSRTFWVCGLIVILGVVMYESLNIRLNSMLNPIYKTAISVVK